MYIVPVREHPPTSMNVSQYIDMCVRMCIWMQIRRSLLQACTHINMHTHTHTRTRTYAHTHTHIRTHAHAHTHTCTHTHTHKHTHTHAHTMIYVHISSHSLTVSDALRCTGLLLVRNQMQFDHSLMSEVSMCVRTRTYM